MGANGTARTIRRPPVWPAAALSSSMFLPLAETAALLPAGRWPTIDQLSNLAAQSAITAESGKPLRFVEPDPNSAQPSYEARVYLQGAVPTRAENWHDLFNALVWLTFPEIKAALNARHYAEWQSRAANERGAVRDALTLFDESGVIVACADPGLADFLREFNWKELFWNRRGETIAQMRFFLFGHALYEKALSPYIGMTGHAVIVDVEAGFMRQTPIAQRSVLDGVVAGYFCAAKIGTRTFSPLPLLGVPGWDKANADESYYANTVYFRPGRSRD